MIANDIGSGQSLKVGPTYKVKVQGFAWKFGKIKMVCVWFHCHKAILGLAQLNFAATTPYTS